MTIQTQSWSMVNKKAAKEHLNFLIDLATMVMVAKDNITTEEEHKMFDKACHHFNKKS